MLERVWLVLGPHEQGHQVVHVDLRQRLVRGILDLLQQCNVHGKLHHLFLVTSALFQVHRGQLFQVGHLVLDLEILELVLRVRNCSNTVSFWALMKRMMLSALSVFRSTS